MSKRLPLTISLIAIGVVACATVVFAFYALRVPTASKSPNQLTPSSSLPVSANKDKTITMIAVGDIMLSRNVAVKMKEHKDINYPFLKVRDYLATADLVFANLEAPITPGPIVKTGSLTFHADPGAEQALKNANISIVSLSNNHTPNYGSKGLLDTFKFLDQAGIAYTGAGKDDKDAYKPTYVEKNGINIAVLAYADRDDTGMPASYEAGINHPGIAFTRIDMMKQAVQDAKKNADLVIISMHAGTEYTPKPNKRQTDFARAAIDAGADLVIGHHPHVVQTVEKYKDKYIIYSLGNFIFDQMWSEDTRNGMTAKITLNKKGVTDIQWRPVKIYDYSQPRMLRRNVKIQISNVKSNPND